MDGGDRESIVWRVDRMWMRVSRVDEDVAMQEQPRTVPCLSPDTASAVSRPLVPLSVNVSPRYIDLLDSTLSFTIDECSRVEMNFPKNLMLYTSV